MRSVLRLAVWLAPAVLGAGAAGCLRDTQHACEVAGACDSGGDEDAAGGDDAGGTDGGGVDARVMELDAATGVIEHVPLDEEMLGTVVLTVGGDRTLNTSTLHFNGSTQPWLTLITSEQGNQVALARLDTFTLEQGKVLDVVGSLPLVIIARRIDVSGTIDASANGATDGPGAILAGTASGGDGVTGLDNDDGGGGGGGHGTAGGVGGDVAQQALGGDAGAASGDPNITTLVGGGRGGRGAASSCARAVGGGGGGAIQLYAMELLSVTGTIDVSGGGGQRNGNCAAGGGGGGAGGALYLQSSSVIALGAASRLASNGGGGGSGGGIGPGADGNDGVPGMFAANGGGAVGGGGAAGGAGGVMTTPPGDGGDATGNGGGGGGAVGRIVAHAPMVNVTLGALSSPAFVRRN